MNKLSRICSNCGGEKVSVYARVCHICVAGDELASDNDTTSADQSRRARTPTKVKTWNFTFDAPDMFKDTCDLCSETIIELPKKWRQCSHCDQVYCSGCIKTRLPTEPLLLIFNNPLCVSCYSLVDRGFRLSMLHLYEFFMKYAQHKHGGGM